MAPTGRAAAARSRVDKVIGVDQVVAERQRAGLALQPVAADQERLGDAFGLRLDRVFEADAKARAVAQQSAGTAADPQAWRSA